MKSIKAIRETESVTKGEFEHDKELWSAWYQMGDAQRRNQPRKRHRRGAMTWPLESMSNPTAVADPPNAQISMRAMIRRASDILTNCKLSF
jgi:hypothetical protein